MANVDITLTEAGSGTDIVILGLARQAAALSKSLALCTEDKAALDNAVTSLQLIDNAIAGNEMQVDVLTLPPLPAGTANIGDVDVLTLPSLPAGANAIGSVTVTSLPALPSGANAIGSVTVTSLPALPAGANNIGSVTVSSMALSASSANIGDVDVLTLPPLVAGTANIGDVDVLTLPALPAGTNNIGDVDVLTLPALPAGTNSIGKLGANAGVNIGEVSIISSQLGTLGQAAMSASVPTAPASDYVPPAYSLPANMVSGAITTAMTGTTSTSLVAAPGASLRNYITTIIVSNSHATVSTDVVIQDGSGGTALLTIPAAAVYGGAVITLPTPLRQPTANTALFCANVTTGASTKVSAVGYKAA